MQTLRKQLVNDKKSAWSLHLIQLVNTLSPTEGVLVNALSPAEGVLMNALSPAEGILVKRYFSDHDRIILVELPPSTHCLII